MNRRTLLQRLAGLLLLGGAGWLLKGELLPARNAAAAPRLLGLWLDRLIPADETPGALDLGLDDRLWSESGADTREALQRGCAWIDAAARQLHGRGFADLTEAQADQVIAATAQAPAGSLPRQFFDHTRFQALAWYWADPRALTGTVWERPPQPVGHPDFQHPPAPRHG